MKKYLIEDLDRKEWYRDVPLHEFPMVHTFCKGWDKPDPEMWTTNPLCALSFDTWEDASIFLLKRLERRLGGNGWIILNDIEFIDTYDQKYRRDIPKNVVISEYELPNE